ncbi:hypothetical protein L1D19_19420 [Vibrio natriegens]|uniref:hypothetical protein n=1 Tax=Vibrio natriegens TaxID=691 RepID=UPI001EFD0085|nr:hypothetical protein [Vibrio natriegens]MCG9702254.1 hypothetical protein [Vibrio natriegens]
MFAYRLEKADSSSDLQQKLPRFCPQGESMFEHYWLSIGRRWLREHIRDRHISLIVRLVNISSGLVGLAQEYGREPEFIQFYQQHRAHHFPHFHAKAIAISWPAYRYMGCTISYRYISSPVEA